MDLDQAMAELAEQIRAGMPAPVDEAVLVERVAARVEEGVASKLGQVMETMRATEGEKVDTEKLTQGVADLLRPQMAEAAKGAAEQVWKANGQALMQAIAQELQAKGQGGREQSADGGTPVGTMNIGDLLRFALGHADEIAKLAQVFRPQKSADERIAETISSVFRWHKVLLNLEKGQASTDELEKSLASIVTKPKI